MSELKMNVFEIFASNAQTYEDALKKKASEQISKKIERFRTTEDGEYKVRVLPLAPLFDAENNPLPKEEQRDGYEYPVYQQFITVKTPAKGKKKAGKISIPVVRTTQKGVDLPVDIIDEYVKIAKDYGEDIADKISKNGFSGGLKWSYQHAMYVLDLSKNRKGPLLYTCSGSQYRSIEDEKFNIWDQLRENRPERPNACPLCSFANAYPLTIKRGNNNNKTEYNFSLNALGKEDVLTEDELNALLNMSRIPNEIYRYTRYQFEATLVFLEQYDEMLQIDVCAQEDFRAAVEQLRAALPKDDTSHFSLDSTGDKGGDGTSKSVEITLDSLWDENDSIEDQGLGKTSDEYKELREKISQYIQDHDLDMRVSHSKSNAQLLADIDELESNNAPKAQKVEEKLEPKPEPKAEAKSEPEPEPEPEEEQPIGQQPEEVPAEEEVCPTRPRRQRPVDDDDEEEENDAKEQPTEQPTEETPVRRRRR